MVQYGGQFKCVETGNGFCATNITSFLIKASLLYFILFTLFYFKKVSQPI